MIVSSPEILSREWMLIGRQEPTGLGGRIDLLAIAPDASRAMWRSPCFSSKSSSTGPNKS